MTITFFGHSVIQIETGGTTILVDPFITGNKMAEGVVSVDELNPDVILLTHAHGDHWGDTPAIAKRTNALVVANFEITSYMNRELGYENTHPMNTGGSWTFDWGKVTQTYARHSSSFPDGTYGGNPNGYLVRAESKCLYLAGDTCAFSEMSCLAEDGEIDVAFLPVGDDFTMGPEEAVECVEVIKPRLTVPVHYDTFPYIEVDMGRFTGAMDKAGYEGRVLAAGRIDDALMLIGVISDTHGYFHPEIPNAFRDVELILHGGDVGPVDVLNELKAIAPVRGVYGNVDGPPVRGIFPETERFELAGVTFLMHHIGGHPNRWGRGVGTMLRAERPDVFICGHSHILRIERVPELDRMLYLNPGAAGLQGFHRQKTCVRLLVEDGAAKTAEVIHLDG